MNIGNQDMALLTLFIREFIRLMKENLGDNYISSSVVSTSDGSILLYDAKDSSVDNTKSGVYQYGIMKSVAMGIKKMKREKDQNQNISDITITYEGQKHVLALSDTRKFMIHLILEDSTNTVLAMRYMRKITEKLIQEYAKKAGADSVKKVDITTYHKT